MLVCLKYYHCYHVPDLEIWRPGVKENNIVRKKYLLLSKNKFIIT